MGRHAWRQGGAAARRAFGAALCSIAAVGRWNSEAEADRYASPPPGWKFFLPDAVPWLAAGFTCRIAPVHTYQVWPLGALGPQAPAGQEGGVSDVCPGNSHDEGPGVCPGANVHEPIILGSTDDESPDTMARRAARQPKIFRKRGPGALAPPAQRPGAKPASSARRPRMAVTPAYTRGTQATAAGAPGRPRPQVEVELATTRCVQCGLDWNDHSDEATEHIAKALRADVGAARDHLCPATQAPRQGGVAGQAGGHDGTLPRRGQGLAHVGARPGGPGAVPRLSCAVSARLLP